MKWTGEQKVALLTSALGGGCLGVLAAKAPNRYYIGLFEWIRTDIRDAALSFVMGAIVAAALAFAVKAFTPPRA